MRYNRRNVRRYSHVNLRTYRKKKLRSNTPVEIEPNTLYRFISDMICMDQSTRNYIKHYVDSYLMMQQANGQLPIKSKPFWIEIVFCICCIALFIFLIISFFVK